MYCHIETLARWRVTFTRYARFGILIGRAGDELWRCYNPDGVLVNVYIVKKGAEQ
jgi:hypothetical protein